MICVIFGNLEAINLEELESSKFNSEIHQEDYWISNNALTRNSFEKWNETDSDGNTVVPFVISDKEYSDDQVLIIEQVMQNISNNTCVKFRERRENDSYYFEIRSCGFG
uniref:Peptidase M12A domain-containing protein n=1 Tax=Ditylenchus dipsaci TaxID=166011 RepID=A0A915CW31_9BILA